MQRNQFGAVCIECSRGVGKNGGFLYYPSSRNIVICDNCIYLAYGQQKGWFAPLNPQPTTPTAEPADHQPRDGDC